MKLYKFRSLANRAKFNWVKDILTTGCFWCSQFSELNDPMEGVFTTTRSGNVDKIIESIYGEKNKYKICSFSDERALASPLMWGYYANGFKGIAIEIEIDEENVKEIDYVRGIPNVNGFEDEAIITNLLTSKLTLWQHEGEYRFLTKSNGDEHKIGTINAVYFGNPFGNTRNSTAIYNDNSNLREYGKLREELVEVVQNSGIKYRSVAIRDSKVVLV